MPPTNEFLQFSPTDTGTNLLTQAEYSADSQRTIGNQTGIARSKLVNKAARQSAVIASQVAQFLVNQTGANALDDGSTANLIALLTASLSPKAMLVQTFLTGSGTYNKSYVFTIASGSATAGATYTNNAFTFTVSTTVSGALRIIMTGTGAPTAFGALTKTAGTGDATLTFYAVSVPLYLIASVQAGGGGGAGSGGGGATNGTVGANSTLGAIITAIGGADGIVDNASRPGGGFIITAPAVRIFAVPGGSSGGAQYVTGNFYGGGMGGTSFF